MNAEVLKAVAEKGLMTGESLQQASPQPIAPCKPHDPNVFGKAMASAAQLRESLASFVAEMQGVVDEEAVICRAAGQSPEHTPEHPARAITFDGRAVVLGGVSANNRRRPV